MGWVGGKNNLKKRIISHFPENYGRYIKVFGGAGWVLFAKDKKQGEMEVYNDLNSDLVTLFRCIKYHPAALQEELLWLPSSREIFFDLTSQLNNKGMTDIQRAARFLYVIKHSFGSTGKTFATAPKNISNTIEYLSKVKERLQNVVIENRNYSDIIKIYDRPDALFYLDPPYVGTEDYYDASFGKDEHIQLAEILHNIKGKFILSYNDCSLIRKLYSDCTIHAFSRTESLSANGKNQTDYKELIVKNF